MTTTDIGRHAEQIAAEHLRGAGFKIIECNWRTRWCEIDIVASKASTVYFVEVKYRKTDNWGDGLDAITHKKHQQMTYAAELWVESHRWDGDYSLIAISLSGSPPTIDGKIEL